MHIADFDGRRLAQARRELKFAAAASGILIGVGAAVFGLMLGRIAQ